VSLNGLTRGQPIKPLVIKLQKLNVSLFLTPEIAAGNSSSGALCSFLTCRAVEEDPLTSLDPWDSAGLMELEILC